MCSLVVERHGPTEGQRAAWARAGRPAFGRELGFGDFSAAVEALA
jgi:hypothetical protein